MLEPRSADAHTLLADRWEGLRRNSSIALQTQGNERSHLARGAALACGAFVLALLLRFYGWDAGRWLMAGPFTLCLIATSDAVRSMHVRWDLHHGGVLFLLYADMMLLTLIAVWTVWPL
ncbi:hypothetical protein Terro_2549 [Terriglobus roseus DSM 18391]|uniref:Uncharacterized protein n=1 Tax=Terriglobus roseus (strain DSM 18391 / NRRL B-41598 / KBS 63) TaxID=926566 RepID=I3ZHS5_TERRK|nr:hypothetical protein [Terriglobus roseus]AFL88451.1 hypothetical protein Terro_2185 [Terriglobus roseus DSM 18391]AFL88793.1 hypothetical protein Terro_2549 [Terriglobus roseus DSM 18391]